MRHRASSLTDWLTTGRSPVQIRLGPLHVRESALRPEGSRPGVAPYPIWDPDTLPADHTRRSFAWLASQDSVPPVRSSTEGTETEPTPSVPGQPGTLPFGRCECPAHRAGSPRIREAGGSAP